MDLQTETKSFLREHGIKQKHLASILGIHPTQLCRWLTGKYFLNESQMLRLKQFLNGNY